MFDCWRSMTYTKKRKGGARYSLANVDPESPQRKSHERQQLPSKTKAIIHKFIQFLKEHRKATLCVLMIIFTIQLCIAYWKIVLNHGTFLPPFVQWRTKPHETQIPKVPQSDFKVPFRVVVSFTTMPHHMGMSISSLLLC